MRFASFLRDHCGWVRALLTCLAVAPWAQAASEGTPEVLVERGLSAMRTNPDESRRDAEAALAALAPTRR